MARVLIIGCGGRGQALASSLIAGGNVVCGTTRDQSRLAKLTEAGIHGAVADPNILGTIMPLLNGVAIVYWLLGSATGDPDNVNALHTERLTAMLERVVDTGV